MTVKRTTRHAFILLALLLGTTLSISAQKKNVRRIQFPPGEETVVVKGVLRGPNDFTYIVHGNKGQTLIATIMVEGNGQASILIDGPGNKRQTNEDGTDAGDDISFVLEQTGDYRIVVFPPEMTEKKDIARYKLEVTLR